MDYGSQIHGLFFYVSSKSQSKAMDITIPQKTFPERSLYEIKVSADETGVPPAPGKRKKLISDDQCLVMRWKCVARVNLNINIDRFY